MADVVGFIGLGNMGMPMAEQLLQAGFRIRAFDLSSASLDRAREMGATIAASIADAADGASIVVTMLPAGGHAVDRFVDDRCRYFACGRRCGERSRSGND